MEQYTVSELKEYLLEKGISEDAVENFEKNEVCGGAFIELTEDDLKELVPLVGVRAAVRAILKEHQKVIYGSTCVQ